MVLPWNSLYDITKVRILYSFFIFKFLSKHNLGSIDLNKSRARNAMLFFNRVVQNILYAIILDDSIKTNRNVHDTLIF